MEKSTRMFWGIDFGVASYMTAILMCENTAGEVYVFDEIGLQNSNTFELAKLMQLKGRGLPVYLIVQSLTIRYCKKLGLQL
jgi:hypothetical protein